MDWVKWHIDTLPEPGKKVIICYRSGFMGMIEFFYDQSAKDCYINGMTWRLQNPHVDMGIIGNQLREIDDSDPIVAWMPAPEPPAVFADD